MSESWITDFKQGDRYEALGTPPTPSTEKWTVVRLKPGSQSAAYAVRDGVQGGNIGHLYGAATIWYGNSMTATGIDQVWSEVWGVDGNQQVGFVQLDIPNGAPRARLWHGSVGPTVDLNPFVTAGSVAYAVQGGHQVGAVFYLNSRASIWTGTRESLRYLDPPASTQSAAYGIDGLHQVGYATVGGIARASLWTGTPSSWVDLNPKGATASRALAVHGDLQVGFATLGGVDIAGYWNGSAASWEPLESVSSAAYAVDDQEIVGFWWTGAGRHAALWHGSPIYREDLHASLPPEFTESVARGIWHNAGTTYVVGYGRINGQNEALLWKQTNLRIAPACDADCNADGALNLADFGCFQVHFALQHGEADCNGDRSLTLADFACFQAKFALGCP